MATEARGGAPASHEYFHSWNVKRIRPQGLDPWQYDRANMTDGLWIAEGFTQYYGPLLEERAGVPDAARVIQGVGRADQLDRCNSPGRMYYGPIGMSNLAPFHDGAAAPDPTPNTFISYYSYGDAIAVALDFSLRARGKSLDEFMRTMWTPMASPRSLTRCTMPVMR